MAFDKTLPASTTKIRDLSTVIPDNWDAIQTADSSFLPEASNLANRTPLAVANDPTAIAETMILYSKDDSAGDPQLYAIDPDSNISTLTPMIPTASANGKIKLPGGIFLIWGTTGGSSGAKTFHSAFPNNCWNVQVTIEDNNARYGSIKTITKNGFTWTPDKAASTIHYFAVGN